MSGRPYWTVIVSSGNDPNHAVRWHSPRYRRRLDAQDALTKVMLAVEKGDIYVHLFGREDDGAIVRIALGYYVRAWIERTP